MTLMRPRAKVERNDGMTTITLTEAMQRQHQNTIAAELEGLTEDLGNCHLVLDCSVLDFIQSDELGTLIGLHKRMRASGGQLSLTNVSPYVYEVFEVTRLTTFMTIHRATA